MSEKKNKGGRPKKQIDKKEFEKLCALQCTKEEIQDWFMCDDKTIDRWVRDEYGSESSFSEIFRQKRGAGKVSLRRKQWQMADKSAAMAIFLGKNLLGQSDKLEQTVSVENFEFVEDSDE